MCQLRSSSNDNPRLRLLMDRGNITSSHWWSSSNIWSSSLSDTTSTESRWHTTSLSTSSKWRQPSKAWRSSSNHTSRQTCLRMKSSFTCKLWWEQCHRSIPSDPYRFLCPFQYIQRHSTPEALYLLQIPNETTRTKSKIWLSQRSPKL
jgi:hypothetical protein